MYRNRKINLWKSEYIKNTKNFVWISTVPVGLMPHSSEYQLIEFIYKDTGFQEKKMQSKWI